MVLHLIKLSVGSTGLESLEDWVRRRAAANERAGRGHVHDHVTRMFPRRGREIVDGGSLYWVIKGVVLARQRIVGLEPETGADGVERCCILLDPPLIPTEAQPRRAFQGWRYLRMEDAPADLKMSGGNADAAAQARLYAQLADLGLL